MKLIYSKTVALLILGGATIFMSGYIFAGTVTGSPEKYGPYMCNSCKLGTPMPDDPTLAFIKVMDGKLNGGLIDVGKPEFGAKGDQFIICNGAACVTYTRTDDGGFEGGEPKPQTTTPPKGGGEGGGGGGGGGGHGGTPGGGGGSTGTVTVRPPQRVP